jgi:hypothetical protein
MNPYRYILIIIYIVMYSPILYEWLAYFNGRAADGAEETLLPQVQVDRRQCAAGHAGVEERVRHVEQAALDGDHVVAVVADHLCQRRLADVVQLRLRETRQRVVSLVPKPVALPQISELDP